MYEGCTSPVMSHTATTHEGRDRAHLRRHRMPRLRYFDEAFNDAIGRELHMGRTLMRLDRSADRIVRHVCYEPNQDPDGPTQKAFGSTRAGFVEELDYDVRAQRGTWRTIPNMWADRVRNAGTIEFSAVAN